MISNGLRSDPDFRRANKLRQAPVYLVGFGVIGAFEMEPTTYEGSQLAVLVCSRLGNPSDPASVTATVMAHRQRRSFKTGPTVMDVRDAGWTDWQVDATDAALLLFGHSGLFTALEDIHDAFASSFPVETLIATA